MSFHSLSLIGLISYGLVTTAIASPIDLDADGVPETIALGASGALEIRAGVGGGVLRALPPPLPNTGFGSTWLVTPNITGDTTPELLITSPSYPDAAGGLVGSVSLFDAQTATLLWTVTGTASHPLTTSILTIGDQDFDGLSEFLVQANGAETRVLVVSSADGAVLATRDGSIGDISQLLASGVSVYSPADRDGNGLVDSADFKDFVDSYEAQAQSADITRDGVVDSADLARFVNGFAEGSITIDAVTTGLASSSSGSGGSGGGTLNPPSNSIPGEQPDDWECGCPEANPNPAECLPAEMTIVCPTIREWPVNGGYIDVPWSVTLPPNATGLGVSCVSQCAGTNPQPQPSAIVVPGVNRVTGTSSIFVQPNQRFVRICYSYQMQGSTEVCTVCASCVPECDLFELSLDIEIESPSFLIPGGTHHFNVVPENTVCDEWIWVVLEGAEWIAEPMFVPQPAPIPGLQPGQLVYIGGNSLEVEIAAADVPFGTSPVVRVAAMCVQTNSCYAAWDGAEGSSFVCDDSDDDLLADCEELAMADGGDCPDHNEPDSDEDGYDDGVEVLHGSNPCDEHSTPVGSRDSDMDGASDFEEEFFRHTNPDRFDQDQDGLQDYAEFLLGTNPRNPMSSGGIRDGALPIAVAADQDADGLIDQYEMERGWDAGNADQDEDGIRDGLEVRRRMNPNKPDQGPAAPGLQIDTDADGLSDAVEAQLGTDSQRRDSDGDGVSDGNEARMGLDPTSARTHCRNCGPTDGEADWDNDGIGNANEDRLGLDPANADSDGDGKCDSQDMDDPQEDSCTPPDPCWTPNTQNGQSADCSGGACFVLNILSCTNNGGSVVVNGERYPLPTCGSGELLIVPVQPGTDFSIAYSCGNWATHGPPMFGAACRSADGTFDQSSFKADPNHGSFAYEKDFYNDQSQCQGASTSLGGFDGAQHGYIPYPTPTLPQPGQNCATECTLLGPPTVNLWIDSNNDSQLAITGVNDLDEQVEDDPSHPGKILFANTRDSDGDRIPDFADGFDADDHGAGSFGALPNPHHKLDNQSPGTQFVPLTISLGGSIPEGTRIKFSYSASPPSAVKPAIIPFEDRTNPSFPVESAGLLRLWTKIPAPRPTNAPRRGNIYQPPDTDGLVMPALAANGPLLDPCVPPREPSVPGRSKLDLASGGSFVDSAVEYPVELLMGGSISNSITLLVEAVRASTTIQEGSIHAQLILPSGSTCDPNSSDLRDTVRCTAVDRQFRPINTSTGALEPSVREVPTSHPTPVITLEPTSGFVVLPPVVSTTIPSQLEANIVIQGTVRDAASNLIPGDAGKIQWLAVVVNGELLRSENGIPLPGAGDEVVRAFPVWMDHFQKKETPVVASDSDAVRRLRPYEFSAQFTDMLRVPVSVGVNTVRLLATNHYGLTGFVEYQFTVKSSAPAPDHARVTLDLHGQDMLTATLPVTLTVASRADSGHFGIPATYILNPIAGRPGEFASVTGITASILSDLTMSAVTVDSVIVEVAGLTLAASAGESISTIQVQVVESAADSMYFAGDEELGANYHPELAYYDYSSEPADVSLRSRSNGGVFAPFALQMVGPPDVFSDEFIGEVDFGERQYVLGVTDEMLATRSDNLAAKQSATFLAIPRFNLNGAEPEGRNEPDATMGDPGLENVPWNQGSASTEAFAHGFGKGLWDTGVEIVEGVEDVGEAIWHIAKHYNRFAIQVRLSTGQGFLLAEDEEKLRASWKLLTTIGELVVKVVNDEIDMVTALYYEDEDRLKELGEEYAIYVGLALDLLAGIKEEIENIKPYQAGWISGRVIGEIAVQVAPALLTGGTSVAATLGFRSAQLANVAGKVRNAAFAQKLLKVNGVADVGMVNRVIHKAGHAADVAVRVATTRICFVAGTLVLTSQGLVPIEQVKPNDIVWAMDEVTREAGWKPVVQTFVTHPTQLHTVTWQTEDGRVDGVTGTGEHPFYVVDADKFVPMESLCVGDTLQLADGTLAWIVKAGLSSGPPNDDEFFTTYNFQVEEFETYFVGETGAWVHNRGPKCAQWMRLVQRSLADVPQLLAAPDVARGRKSFLRAFEIVEDRRLARATQNAITNADRRELILGLSEEVVKDAISGTVDSKKTFGWSDWDNFFTRLGPDWKRSQPDLQIEINHGVPQALFRDLNRSLDPPGTAPHPLRAIDINIDVPAFPLKVNRHSKWRGIQRDGLYQPTFHDLLEGTTQGFPRLLQPTTGDFATDARNLKDAIVRAHNQMHDLYGAEDDVNYRAMGEIVSDFFARRGVH